MKSQAEHWMWIIFGILASGVLLGIFARMYYGMKRAVSERMVDASFERMAKAVTIGCSSLRGYRVTEEAVFTDSLFALYASSTDSKPPIDVADRAGEESSGTYLCIQKRPVNSPHLCIDVGCNVSVPYFVGKNVTGGFFYNVRKILGKVPVSVNNVTIVRYSGGVKIFINPEGSGGGPSLDEIEGDTE